MIEIERKFLVENPDWKSHLTGPGRLMCQSYLSTDPERVVRVRVDGDRGYLTIKGMTQGISRPEYEYQIPLNDAGELIRMGCHSPIEKIRHVLWWENRKWEIDEFLGANEGLVVAEIELEDSAATFALPFDGMVEVSDDQRYFNNQLALNPYSTWRR